MIDTFTSVVSSWLATPRPPSGTVPSRPTMAESASRNSGSAPSAPKAGSASRRISPSSGLRSRLSGRSAGWLPSANHAPGPQVPDVGRGQAKPAEDRVRVRAEPWRNRRGVSLAPAEPWCWRWLADPGYLHEGVSGDGVRVHRYLGQAQHRRHAGVGPANPPLPLGSGATGEGAGEPLPQHRPAIAVVLRGQAGLRQAEPVHEPGVEPMVPHALRHVPALGGGGR